ncbi:hypothetical protein B0H19DRAFT_1265283 [Mycena capillaripes]|nr:hypothetical protein B0H19DRAFT_1265283 [Mycena capillaripes]
MSTDRRSPPQGQYAPQPQRPFFNSSLNVGGQQSSTSSGVYETSGSRATFQSSSGGSFGGGGGLARGPSRGPGPGGPPEPPRGPPGRGRDYDVDEPDAGPGPLISRGGGEPGEQRIDLIEFLTSQLLKLTVIAQPDLKSLLMHPALRRLIMDIALQASQLATTDALDKMQKEMLEMQAKMQNWMSDAMELNIAKRMEIELDPLARNSAVYSLGALKRMRRNQIAAYNSFAPEIGAPEIPEPHVSGFQDDVD